MQHVEFRSVSSISLADDYPEAVLSLATSYSLDSAQLLFGLIELIPKGVAPPVPARQRRREWRDGRALSFTRAFCSTAEALRFRQMIAAGGPVDVAAVLGASFDSLPTLSVGAMSEEPPWPRVALCKQGVAFLSAWHGQPRVHHTLSATIGRDTDPAERARLFEWVSECFFFHAEEHPELLGSLHLVAPNPRYAELDVHRVPHPSHDAPEAISLCFAPREGDDLQGLSVRVTSVRPTGVLGSHQIPVREPLMQINFDHTIDAVSVEVVDELRGTLEEAGPFMFWRGDSHVTVSIVEASDVPMPGAVPRDQLPPRDAVRRLHVGAALRAARDASRALTVFGDHDGAWETKRAEILSQGHRFLLVVTPGLGDDDVETLRAWSRDGAQHLFVLLCDAPTMAGQPSVGEHEVAAYVELRRADGEALVAGSYLVTAEHLWSFTGPPSKLGGRGTTLHALPTHDALRERLYAAWHGAALVARIDAHDPFVLDVEALLASAARRVA